MLTVVPSCARACTQGSSDAGLCPAGFFCPVCRADPVPCPRCPAGATDPTLLGAAGEPPAKFDAAAAVGMGAAFAAMTAVYLVCRRRWKDADNTFVFTMVRAKGPGLPFRSCGNDSSDLRSCTRRV